MQEGLRMDDTRNEICRKVLETPLEEIQEDVSSAPTISRMSRGTMNL